MSENIIFHGGRVLGPDADTLIDGLEVLVADGVIREVSDRPIRSDIARRHDLEGQTLLPGLIDAHVHVVASALPVLANVSLPSSLAALRAAQIMTQMLRRGFTTVRDCGGADRGLVQAVEEGLVQGPRMIISGKALSQTGGHGDFRARSDNRDGDFSERVGALCRWADGVEQVRLAARGEIKGGADFIKVMANGGVASDNDPIHALGYSRDELKAIVEEAENAGLYVSAHLYTDASIRRAVECGIHSLEHCSLITSETARMAVEAGCIAIPTVTIFDRLAKDGARLGLGASSLEKVEIVRKAAIESLDTMRAAGLPMAYGTDLLADMHVHQLSEFEVRAQVMSPVEILQSATTVGARLCRMDGRIGTIAPAAFADLLIVNGDPLKDIHVLAAPGGIRSVMSRGVFLS